MSSQVRSWRHCGIHSYASIAPIYVCLTGILPMPCHRPSIHRTQSLVIWFGWFVCFHISAISLRSTFSRWWQKCGNTLRWRHNERDSVSNHQPRDGLLNCLFRRRSKKTSKLRVTGLCVGNSPGTGEFPAQMASNAENVSIWWRHHDTDKPNQITSDCHKQSHTCIQFNRLRKWYSWFCIVYHLV